MSLVQPPQNPPALQQYVGSQQRAAAPPPSSASAATPPASSRRPTARTDHNASLPNSPQQTQHNSAMNSPRGQSSTSASSPSGAMNSSTYTQFYPDAAAATTLPIRASSSHQSSTFETPAASYDTRGYNSRSQPTQTPTQAGYGSGSDGERRQGHQSPREDQPGSGRSQRSRNTPSSSRSATAIGQPPMGTDLPRENSAVINRIVVDDPQADLAREEARKAEVRSGASTQPAEPAPVQRSRQEHLKHASSQNRKEVKFGDYILGQTIGEGEFGKVKMGWKRDSTVQVAIKLIKKETLAGNTARLPKIYREIHILRELNHPNIVRLHEFVETERHMGIILEYASGGELFDYILNHRYLKDPAARRLFAQLVSGVGYLHKKGIVHRDLKLENLLLDRNKHIIITDFGFANTFNPADELGDEVENRISDKDFIKRQGLDKIIPWRDGREGGHRRGDLMQTSCGSPCYAAPELVVSDGLYTGRKVDVWSCGVILYAMLAGYLPFDDDPANPEGDNINLLYKYIVSTPLTFPEYVTPHARDLLRRILVPDPRRRADLFEVARHSWLSEYTNVVGFIGSRVKSDNNNTIQDGEETPLGRSSSVREPTSRGPADRSSVAVSKHAGTASVGGDDASDIRKQQRDAKRRTVQVEYVAPNMTTSRHEATPDTSARKPVPASASSATKTRARTEAQGPVEVTPGRGQDGSMLPPSRQQQRAVSDSTNMFGTSSGSNASRPNTSGALGAASRLPSRGNSYSQPSAAQPTTTTAQGRISQPKSGPGYIISGGPVSSETGAIDPVNRPVSEQARTGGQFSVPQTPQQQGKPSGHKRSSTLGSLADKVMNRSNSRRVSQQQQQQDAAQATSERKNRKYPPVSMKNAMPNAEVEQPPRPSTDSRRPSFGFNRKASKEREPSLSGKRGSRRFSWLPGSLSMGNFASKREQGYDSAGDDGYRPPGTQQSQQSHQSRSGRPASNGMIFGRKQSGSPLGTSNSTIPLYQEEDRERQKNRPATSQMRYDKELPRSPDGFAGPTAFPSPPPVQRKQFRDDGYGNNLIRDDPVERFYTPSQEPQPDQYVIGGNGDWEHYEPVQPQRRDQSLRPHKRMGDAYDHGNGGSSSATRRVMDFFRRRGKEREM